MPRYEHLRLIQLPERMERRKTGSGRAPDRDPPVHGARLRTELDTAVDVQRRRRRIAGVDPTLILRIQMAGDFQEVGWDQVGLTVLSTDEDRTLLLFASNDELQAFRGRLDAFSRGIPDGQKGPSYASFIGGIERIGPVEPADRIGPKLKLEGFNSTEDFDQQETYLLDLELWDLGQRPLRQEWVGRILDLIEDNGGEVLDEYFGPSITMIRFRAQGSFISTLLDIEVIATIDLPPEPDLGTAEALDLALADLPARQDLPEDAPIIGIIDSGMNVHPLIEDLLVGAISVPDGLGTADEWGHGTRVGGVAVFGDLREQINQGIIQPFARLCSAKVVNERGQFDDYRLTPKLMREAVERLHRDFGCRIFVSALADIRQVYDGGKVGPWAATLDELVRELDVVILVAAGNGLPATRGVPENAVTQYPGYLLEASNRLYEPAGALNIVTVGALAHGHGVSGNLSSNLWMRPITETDHPSPFTRIGPGVGGSIKPDLVDTGGTAVFNAATQLIQRGDTLPSAGILTLHHRFLDRLFTTQSGTSYAAPLVAAKAAQILARFPNASANLIRALLIGSATLPSSATDLLTPLGGGASTKICGHGRIDLERAAFSDDNRVVLYADTELEVDQFAIFEVPMPDIFQEKGRRNIQVTLAYDPPVRHKRKDYPGVVMSFRLHRGDDPDLLYNFYRRRNIKEEGRHNDLAHRHRCIFGGSEERERSSVQVAKKSFIQDTSNHGDTWHLVVRCEGGWAADLVVRQRYALLVEFSHEEPIRLYDRLRVRIRV